MDGCDCLIGLRVINSLCIFPLRDLWVILSSKEGGFQALLMVNIAINKKVFVVFLLSVNCI
jgi:hypothetical protein